MIGLATLAAATRPAEGSYVSEYEAAAFSFVSTVLEASTCIENVQPSASAEVVTWWGVFGITMFVVLLVVAVLITYTVWLFRYVGFCVPPPTADAGIQTEKEWWAYQLVDSPRAVPVVPATVDRSDTAAAPPTVIALANGRCFHLPGCQYTMKRTAQNTRVIKPGVLSYKRCDVCMPAIGKHWGA